MPLDSLYTLLNAVVMPFWLLMILVPGWSLTRRVMQSLWPAAIVPVIYAGLLGLAASGMGGAALDFSLDGIADLLGTPIGALVAWAHFLALDLFTGRWVYLDSRDRSIPTWLAALILFFCLMSGPIGLLLYILVRTFRKDPQP